MTDYLKTCKINGINIHYTRTGGKKPVLVLLHGLAANGECWKGLIPFLANDFDIIMPDSRGHGESSLPGHGLHYNQPERFDAIAISFIYLIDKSHLL